ncbi:MAG TPA: hypothetical protein EYG34_07105 [Acidimicrobiia bacterium]|nr:hypothetical protein [Acidimicrobiia bacterium]HIL46865.1 hypothetical protein [Acidimicrobiia bacterium]
MKKFGIRSLKQNASAVVAQAVAGETIIITDRGSRLTVICTPQGALQTLLDSAPWTLSIWRWR